ncbi:DUF5685 family protein [Nocardia macrotermitis]|uniref:Uncharacterized protein n=1 Tax=Nocardia macrotermitis TaxID=2585198 RepID=A0A7K0DDH3_9NOCA|nr:DUF5685 family protein [Nocardia macrotermitis]MQY23541.1 hypothetical protein [Nocardia macrotermitis]
MAESVAGCGDGPGLTELLRIVAGRWSAGVGCRIEGVDVFGLLRPCAHSAAKYGIGEGEFFAQMCGLCLGLRDGHSQVARAATNTDAIVLTVLTEAQRPEAAVREAAGACPLRGMRRASVAGASTPGVRLAATASLLLAAAKIRDHVDDGEAGVLRARPMARVAAGWFARAREGARDIGLDIEPLIAAIDAQPGIERAVAAAQVDSDAGRSGGRGRIGRGTRIGGAGEPAATTRGLDTLAELTYATQLCTAELFAHTAILAGCPENADALRDAGWYFGRIAHLADAIEDLEQDRRNGKFNPLAATGTTRKRAYALLRESNSHIEAAVWRAGLSATPTVRWALLDPVTGVVRRMRRSTHTCTSATHTCSHSRCGNAHAHSSIPTSADPAHTVQLLGFPAAPGLIDLTAASGERTTTGPIATQGLSGQSVTEQPLRAVIPDSGDEPTDPPDSLGPTTIPRRTRPKSDSPTRTVSPTHASPTAKPQLVSVAGTPRLIESATEPALFELVAAPSLVRLATTLSPIEARSNPPGPQGGGPNEPYQPNPYQPSPYTPGPGGSNPYEAQPGPNTYSAGPRPGPYGPGTPNQPGPYGTNPGGPRPGPNPYGPGNPNNPGPQPGSNQFGPGPTPQYPYNQQQGTPQNPNNPVPYDIPAPFSDRPNNAPRYDPATPLPAPPKRPGLGTGLAIICGAYCTGYACCATHRRPCSGVEQGPWIRRSDCWCDCCDGCCEGCSCCSDCDSCGCCDGCCCDC